MPPKSIGLGVRATNLLIHCSTTFSTTLVFRPNNPRKKKKTCWSARNQDASAVTVERWDNDRSIQFYRFLSFFLFLFESFTSTLVGNQSSTKGASVQPFLWRGSLLCWSYGSIHSSRMVTWACYVSICRKQFLKWWDTNQSILLVCWLEVMLILSSRSMFMLGASNLVYRSK